MRRKDVFPARNLGAGEPWGRKVEERILNTERDLDFQRQFVSNLGRRSDAQDDILSKQLSQLEEIVVVLEVNQARLAEGISTGTWSTTVAGNAWGDQHFVEAPDWAFSGIVIAGMAVTSSSSSAWSGHIELIASNAPPVTGDIDSSKDPARLEVDAGTAYASLSNPRIIQSPVVSEDTVKIEGVYLRPRGVRLTGTSSITYTISSSYAIIWM